MEGGAFTSVLIGNRSYRAARGARSWITSNPEVIGSSVGLVPRNALVLINGVAVGS